MKKLLAIILCLCSLCSKFQAKDTTNLFICPKTLESLVYHAPKHVSPKFKVTCRAAINKVAVEEILYEGISEAFDGIEFSQIAKYNLRIRWQFENKNKIFFGVQTMLDSAPGKKSNTYYVGFVKRF